MSTVLLFAGPNGSGKSTITSNVPIIGEYVNADLMKQDLHCTDLEAAQIAESTREYFLKENQDFTFESVLSTDRNICLLERAKEKNYTVVCIYVLTANPNINVHRVAKRVQMGGHPVPKEKIVQRYYRALALFPSLFPICDELYVFDNSLDSEQGDSRLILSCLSGSIEKFPNEIWSKEMLDSLMAGNYPDEYLK